MNTIKMNRVVMTIGRWVFGFLTLVGFCLSAWIVLPAPIFSLLPLSVGAPEVSPGLILFNATVPILGWVRFRLGNYRKPRLLLFALCLSGLAVGLSALPLLQFSLAQQQAQRSVVASLGQDYLRNIPRSTTPKMRPQPLIISDIWGGISTPEIRIDRSIPFASPDGIPLLLNIYRPRQVGIYPAIISIYGGAW